MFDHEDDLHIKGSTLFTVRCGLTCHARLRVSVPYGSKFNCSSCAERALLKTLVIHARRQGVHAACISHWIHRKYGDLVIQKIRHDGQAGTSLPCVLCRKALDRWSIQWRAHIDQRWIKSNDSELPKAKPTNNQKLLLGFK